MASWKAERRSAWSPALPHHSIGEVVEAGLREMMRDDFGLGRRALWIVAQRFGGAAVQRLPAAFEQALVGCVLDQRMLEAIVGLWRRALDKQEVGFGEPLQRRLQRRLVELDNVAQQRVGKIASKHRTDLRDVARRAEPIEARSRDCCKVGGMA